MTLIEVAAPPHRHDVAWPTSDSAFFYHRYGFFALTIFVPKSISDPNRRETARGQSQLRQAFEFTNYYAMPQPELLVFRAHEKFDAQGRLTDEPTRQFLAKFLGALAEWTTRFKTAPG